MLLKKPNFFFALCFVFIIASCTKEDKPYEPVTVCGDISNRKGLIDHYLIGSWTWLQDKSYNYGGSINYNTPATAGFRETITIDSTEIKYLRFHGTSVEKTVFNYKIRQEKEYTTVPTDNSWVLAIYNTGDNTLINWWRVYICQNNLILSMAYRGELYADVTYVRK